MNKLHLVIVVGKMNFLIKIVKNVRNVQKVNISILKQVNAKDVKKTNTII